MILLPNAPSADDLERIESVASQLATLTGRGDEARLAMRAELLSSAADSYTRAHAGDLFERADIAVWRMLLPESTPHVVAELQAALSIIDWPKLYKAIVTDCDGPYPSLESFQDSGGRALAQKIALAHIPATGPH